MYIKLNRFINGSYITMLVSLCIVPNELFTIA